MAWSLADLKAADAALSPPQGDPAEAATVLTAQTKAVAVDVTVQSIAGYLGMTGKLTGFMAWAAAPPAGASGTAIAAATALAFAFQHPQLLPVFEMTNPSIAAAMTTWLDALVSPGGGIAAPIDAADQTAILSLASATVPVWQPAPSAGDVQTARAQP
jgi:hypothetical protein